MRLLPATPCSCALVGSEAVRWYLRSAFGTTSTCRHAGNREQKRVLRGEHSIGLREGNAHDVGNLTRRVTRALLLGSAGGAPARAP